MKETRNIYIKLILRPEVATDIGKEFHERKL